MSFADLFCFLVGRLYIYFACLRSHNIYSSLLDSIEVLPRHALHLRDQIFSAIGSLNLFIDSTVPCNILCCSVQEPIKLGPAQSCPFTIHGNFVIPDN